LAEQCVAVFLGSVGKVNYKGFHLLAGSLTEELSAAEVDGVGLDEVGIELILADELAEAVLRSRWSRCDCHQSLGQQSQFRQLQHEYLPRSVEDHGKIHRVNTQGQTSEVVNSTFHKIGAGVSA